MSYHLPATQFLPQAIKACNRSPAQPANSKSIAPAIQLYAVCKRDKNGSAGIAVVGHFNTNDGRADYSIAQPIGDASQNRGDILAVFLALHSIKAKHRDQPVVLRTPSTHAIKALTKDAAGEYPKVSPQEIVSLLRLLAEKFTQLTIEEFSNQDDLFLSKAIAFARKSSTATQRTPGTNDEFAYPT